MAEAAPPGPPPVAEVAPGDSFNQAAFGGVQSPENPEEDLAEDLAEGFDEYSGGDGDDSLDDTAPEVLLQMSEFTSECCTMSDDQACTARDLYVAYLQWCDLNQHPPALQRNFGLGLRQMGFRRRRRSHGKHWWLGLSVDTEDGSQLADAA